MFGEKKIFLILTFRKILKWPRLFFFEIILIVRGGQVPLTLTQCKFNGKTVCVCTCCVLDWSLGSNYQASLVCINKSECFVLLIDFFSKFGDKANKRKNLNLLQYWSRENWLFQTLEPLKSNILVKWYSKSVGLKKGRKSVGGRWWWMKTTR